MTGLFNYPKRKLRKFIENGEYEEAIHFANTLEEKFSKDPDFLFIMGSMYYFLRDENKTLHYIEKVLNIDEYDIEALSLKLRVYQFLKDDDTVIDCCKKILSVDSENHEVKDILDQLEQV